MLYEVTRPFERQGVLQTVGSIIDVPGWAEAMVKDYVIPVSNKTAVTEERRTDDVRMKYRSSTNQHQPVDSQLIPVESRTIGDDTVPTVNARDLHAFLGVSKDFSSWIKDQIARLRLVENRDFIIFTEKGEYRKPLIEYYLTIDAAKHISLMSGTDRGFEIREYFIACEKKTKLLPADPLEAQILATLEVRRNQLALEAELKGVKTEQKVISIGLSETRHEISKTREEVKDIRDTWRIENWQQQALREAVNCKSLEIVHLYPLNEKKDVWPKVWNYFKRMYHIPRYQELPAIKFDEAMAVIKRLTIDHLPGLQY